MPPPHSVKKSPMDSVRLDIWLWAVRVFKTRSLATEACRQGKVKILGSKVKPSRGVHPGDCIELRNEDLTRTLRVVGLLHKRVGAPQVAEFMLEETPEEVLRAHQERQKEKRLAPTRQKGLGRPTKKDRRALGRVLMLPEDL